MKRVLFTLILILLAPRVTFGAQEFTFEFLDSLNQFEPLAEFPYARPHLIVITSPTREVSALLPIAFEIYINGEGTAKGSIPDNLEDNCRNEYACAIEGPIIPDPGVYASLEIYAYDKDGSELASYIQPGLGYEGPFDESWIPPRGESQFVKSNGANGTRQGIWFTVLAIITAGVLGGIIFFAKSGKKMKASLGQKLDK